MRRLGLLAGMMLALFGVPSDAPAFSTYGAQHTLVIPIEYGKPCPDDTLPCPAMTQAITSPRLRASDLFKVLDDGVNRHYLFGSYGRMFFDFRVVANPDSANGYWPATNSPQVYALRRNFADSSGGGLGDDAVLQTLGQAIDRGVISLHQVLRYDRVLVVDNWHARGGQSAGPFPITYRLRGREWPVTMAAVRPDVSDAQLVSVAKHELGHEVFLNYDLYSTPCDPDGNGIWDPCRCPLVEPGSVAERLPNFSGDCIGLWDTMGADLPDVGFGAFSRVAGGWLDPDDPWVRTVRVPAPAFSGRIVLRPLEATPVRGRTSLLRLPYFSLVDIVRGAPDDIATAYGTAPPFLGYQAECRRQISGDERLPSTGVVLTWLDDRRARGGKPIHAVRAYPRQPANSAILRTYDTYRNAETGLELTVEPSPPGDDSCVISVNYGPERRANLAGLVAPGPGRADWRTDLIGDQLPTSLFMAGGVGIGPKTDGLRPIAPEAGAQQTLRFAYANAGTARSRGGTAKLRVSQPYAAAPPCGPAPTGRPAGSTALARVPAGDLAVGELRWTPRSGGSAGLTVDLDGRKDASRADDAITSAFAFQTHRIEGAPKPERVAIELTVPGGCPGAAAFDVVPLAVPKGWEVQELRDVTVGAGEERVVRIGVRPPRGAREGTVSIPLAVSATDPGDPGEGVGLPEPRPVGGIDVVARVVRGDGAPPPFRLTPTMLRRPAKAPDTTFPLPQPLPTPTAIPTPTPTLEPSSIQLTCPDVVKSGQDKLFLGQITPAHAASVGLAYRSESGKAQDRQVSSAADGAFQDIFNSQVVESWTLTASWAGDTDTAGATASCGFQVVP
jgi:hypothetical protein